MHLDTKFTDKLNFLNKDKTKRKLMPVRGFKETTLLLMNYDNRKTIWEHLILKGIEHGKVKITDC